jgi:hypothetical protein
VDVPVEVLGDPLNRLDKGAGPPLDEVFAAAVDVDVLIGADVWAGRRRRGGIG